MRKKLTATTITNLQVEEGKAKVEVATSSGQSYIEALQAAAEVIKLRSDSAV